MNTLFKSLSLFLILGFLTFFVSSKVSAVDPDVVCIGEAIADYMNEVTAAKSQFPKISLLSPAFNMTSPFDPPMYQSMVDNGARFGDLWGFAGNVYRLGGQDYDYYYADTYGWRSRFSGRNVVFTEFGDIDSATAGHQDVSAVQRNYNRVLDQDRNVQGTLLFAARSKNPQFSHYNLSDAEINTVFASNKAKGGLNSADWFSGGSYPNQVEVINPSLGWALEIAGNQGDLPFVVESIKAAHRNNQRIVLRICFGESCAFYDDSYYDSSTTPETNDLTQAQAAPYIQFLKSVNDAIATVPSGVVFAIAGPNEPSSESWAAPHCTYAEKRNYTSPSRAQCNETFLDTPNPDDIEFHSLRPYPGAPCEEEKVDLAAQCGNDLIIQQTFEVQFNEGPHGTALCEHKENTDPLTGLIGTTDICTMERDFSSQVKLIFDGAELPIAGNTEDVPNSKTPVSEKNGFSFKQRLNEYVSWYLNGITGRAEEDLWEDEHFSEVGLDTNERIIHYVINLSGPIKKLLPQAVLDAKREEQKGQIGTDRHNQIGVCTLGLGTGEAASCYVDDSYTQWFISDLFRSNVVGSSRYPEFIPPSSTEDLKGEIIGAPHSGGSQPTEAEGNEVTIKGDPTFTPVGFNTETVYFPHMEEDTQLASLLQGVFRSRSLREYAGVPNTKPLEINNRCEIVNTRSNPGDSLLAEYNDADRPDEQPITGTLAYHAEFKCEWRVEASELAKCMRGSDDPTAPLDFGLEGQCREDVRTKCEKDALVAMKVTTNMPKALELWERLVAGPSGVFRRFYPKFGPGTPIEELEEIPGETKVTYQANALTGTAGEVSYQTFAGDPRVRRPGTDAKLYFPYVGGLHEYFLKGIQKALCPKDMCFESKEASDEATIAGDADCVDVPDSEIPAKWLGAFKQNFITMADKWVPGGAENGNQARKCYNDVVKRSIAANVNPAFALSIWLNESDASNYLATGGQDFGQNLSTLNTFGKQINRFLEVVGSGFSIYKAQYSDCFNGNSYSDIQDFMFVFQNGPGLCGARNEGQEALSAAAKADYQHDPHYYYKTIFGTLAGKKCAKGFQCTGPTYPSCEAAAVNCPGAWELVTQAAGGCSIPANANAGSCP